MIEMFLLCFVLILAVLGVTEILGYIRFFLKKPKNKLRVYSVFFLGETDIDSQLDFIISKSLWYGKRIGEYILVVAPSLALIPNKAKIEKNYNIVFCDFYSIEQKFKRLGDDFYEKRN